MTRDPFRTWWSAGFDLWGLGLEASAVVAMRTAKLAQGGTAAAAEANLMVAEKLAAVAEAQVALMTGGFGTRPETVRRKLVSHYRTKIRANHRRLGRRSS